MSACASGPATNPAPLPPNDPAAIAIAAATPLRWTGNLQGTLAHTSDVVMTDRMKASGTVELTVLPDRPTRTHARLSLSAPATAMVTSLRWAISPGSCGSGSPPVVPAEIFPRMEMGSNGRGSIDQEIALEMPREGSFHVNVLQGSGNQLTNVFACANLRRSK